MALALGIAAVVFAAGAALASIIIRKHEEREGLTGELFSDRDLRKQQKRHRAHMAL